MTRGQRIGLAAGAAAVAVLVIGLWWGMRRPHKPAAARAAAGDHSPPAPGAGGPIPRRPDTRRDAAPGQASADTPSDPGEAPPTIVRDHTSDEPHNPSPIQPYTVAEIRTQMQPLYRKCSAPLRGKNPPPKGRIIVTATVSVASGRVVVHDVGVDQKDIDEPDFVDCVTKAFEGITFDAEAGQTDVEHKIKVPFVVP